MSQTLFQIYIAERLKSAKAFGWPLPDVDDPGIEAATAASREKGGERPESRPSATLAA